MRFSHRVPLARVAAVLSMVGVVGAIACSDAATTVRPFDIGSAALDKGGSGNSGKGNQGSGNQKDTAKLGKGNEGPGNQNNPKDTVNQNNQRIKLEARLMPVAADTTFRGAEGRAEFENRTTEMKFKISVEHIAAGTVVNFFVGTTMIGSATTRAGGEAQLNFDSNKGDTVPVAAAGTAVSAKTAGGQVIASGTF
jgi:hypothetical protein